MKEVPRVKRLAVAQYYLLGNTYDDIEARTGVSHGSIVNIAREIESGDLTLSGISSDQVNDLRQLSAEL